MHSVHDFVTPLITGRAKIGNINPPPPMTTVTLSSGSGVAFGIGRVPEI